MKSQLFKLTKEIIIQANDASTSEFDHIVPVDESDSGRDMLAYSLRLLTNTKACFAQTRVGTRGRDTLFFFFFFFFFFLVKKKF
jgi:hypothetical protein